MKILTFDIEDWFHILDNGSTKMAQQWETYDSRIHESAERILTTLNDNGQKGTFFCLGWIAKKYPEVIKSILSAGHEIGTHSHMHQLVYELDKVGFEEDLRKSIYTIEDITGQKVKYFRAPGFSITPGSVWAFEALVEQGIEIDCSIFPALRSHGGFSDFGSSQPSIIEINGCRIKELPINIHYFLRLPIIYSGGGYFRLLPFQLIDYWSKVDDYVMTYFHPRDFDPDQPMLHNLPIWRKFKSYVGLRSSLSKFQKLLKRYEFVDIKQANRSIDWGTVNTISLSKYVIDELGQLSA